MGDRISDKAARAPDDGPSAAASGSQSGRVPQQQDTASSAPSTQTHSFTSRIASSASALARDAFTPDKHSAASTLSRGLESSGKANGASQASSSSASASYDTFASSARAGSSATASPNGTFNGLSESFRSQPLPQQGNLSDEMQASPLVDDARNSIYGSYPASMYEQWASIGKGKARQSSSDQGQAWAGEFTQDAPDGLSDIERIYGSNTDGADVLSMLDDPGFSLEQDLEAEPPQPEPSADDLFGPGASDRVEKELPKQKETSRLFPSDPGILADMTGLRSSVDGGDSALATGSWLSAWSDVLEHYTDYVWSAEEKAAIEEAREEMNKLKDTPQPEAGAGASQAVRRLQQILGHINPKAVARSRAPAISSEIPAQPIGVDRGQGQMQKPQQPDRKRSVQGRRESVGVSRSPSPESWD